MKTCRKCHGTNTRKTTLKYVSMPRPLKVTSIFKKKTASSKKTTI